MLTPWSVGYESALAQGAYPVCFSANTPAVAKSPTRLPKAVDAERYELQVKGVGRVSYYRAGPASGRPLLLIHSINAAPSAYEMRPLFEHYRQTRPVIAPDLPGFGFSERADRPYSPALFVDAIKAIINDVIGAPVDLIAFSLSAEFAAQVARALPDQVRSLVFLSPTGFSTRTMPGGEAGLKIHRVLRTPVLSQGLFAALTSKISIRYFLGISFVGPVPQGMIDYAHATAHQPGARHAPLYFLSGQLFTENAADTLYADVTQPALVLHDQDPNINFDLMPEFLAGRSNWRVQRITPTLGVPQWEKPAETIAAIDQFWAETGQS